MSMMMDWQNYQAVYVDIPFCVSKCLYCDFPSYAGHTEETMRLYAHGLCREITERAAGIDNLNEDATIFFGGGTPSVLPVGLLAPIVRTLKECGLWQHPAEATIEVNPGTADVAKLSAYRELGFDRISFGVQSLVDSELRTIGRIHTGAQALESIAWAQQAGFERISCDLIYGLPQQTLASLQYSLQTALASGVSHISVYGLIVEEGTPLERMVAEGSIELPNEDASADMYEYIQDYLAAQGFARYEISNYARPGQASRHNMVYWRYQPYLGFGCSATTYTGAERYRAQERVESYLAAVGELQSGTWQESALYERERISAQEALGEFMFMGLRTARGADLWEARERFGVDVLRKYEAALVEFFRQTLVVTDAQQHFLKLTPAGMEVGNSIFELFV